MKKTVHFLTHSVILFSCFLLILLAAACKSGQTATTGSQITEIQAPEQQTEVTYKNKLTLVIPPDTVPAGSRVSISEVKGAPAFEYSGRRTLSVYDITIGDQATFYPPLQIQFRYDPAKLRSEVSAADQLVTAYLDEASGRWVETNFNLDKDTNTVSIFTDHLTLWGLFGVDNNVAVSTAPHFKIFFNEDLNAPMLGDKPSGAGLMYDFAAQVRTALVDAYDAYDKAPGSADAGFKLPEMTKVYIDDWGAEKTAEWGWFSKYIEIPTSYSDLDELKQDSAHELFHAIQNQYTTVIAMNSNRWFMEGSADYAAANIGTSNGLKTVMDLDFIKKPLTDPEDKHMYRVAHFFQYMDQQGGLGFKDLAEAVLSAGGDALGGMEGFALARGVDLQEVYTDFAQAFIFSNSLKRAALPTDSPLDLADYKGTFSKSETRLATEVNIPGEYVSRLVGYEIIDDASIAPYKVYLSMLDESSLVKVRYFIVSEGIMDSGDLTSGKPVEVEVRGGTQVYFLVTNSNENQGTVTVVLEQKPTMMSTAYSNSRTALIYNQDYTGTVSFTLTSSAPFEIVREVEAPNGEVFLVDLRIPDLSKGAEINVEAAVDGIALKDQAAHANLTASLEKVWWYVSSIGEVSGGSTNVSIPANSKDGISLEFRITITCVNSLSNSSTSVRCGSGTVVMIRIGP
jgi:hypothetical protein